MRSAYGGEILLPIAIFSSFHLNYLILIMYIICNKFIFFYELFLLGRSLGGINSPGRPVAPSTCLSSPTVPTTVPTTTESPSHLPVIQVDGEMDSEELHRKFSNFCAANVSSTNAQNNSAMVNRPSSLNRGNSIFQNRAPSPQEVGGHYFSVPRIIAPNSIENNSSFCSASQPNLLKRSHSFGVDNSKKRKT